MLTKIGATLGALIALASIVGAVKAVDGYYATTAEVSAISERLEQKILSDQIAALQARIWDAEDRWSERFYRQNDRYPASNEELVAFMSEEARQVYRDMVAELEELEARREGEHDPD